MAADLGAVVDSFKTVVRYNQFHVEPPYSRRVGSKTSIWVTIADFANDRRGPTRRSPELYGETAFFIWGPDDATEHRNYQSLAEKTAQRGGKLGWIPMATAREMSKREEFKLDEPVGPRTFAVPSTGIVAIEHYRRAGRFSLPAYFLGFDSFRASDSDPDGHHYFWTFPQDRKPAGWHDSAAEGRFLAGLVRAGVLCPLTEAVEEVL